MAKTAPEALSTPQAILFDWDGTLVDTHPALAAAMNVTLETFGQDPWTFEQWSEWLGKSANDAFPSLFGDDWEQAKQIYFDSYGERHLETLILKDGAAELIESLSALPLFLGVVSNKTGRYLRAEVSHLNWDDHFGHLVGAGDSASDKPAPDPVYDALRAGGYDTGPHIWFVGDNDVDVACGRAAKCTTVLIGEGYPEAMPDLRVDDLFAVKTVIHQTLDQA